MRERLKSLALNIRAYAEFRRQAKQPGCSKQLDMIADELESAIRPQWVPVAERLPSYGQRVFVINRTEDGEEEMMLASSYDYDDGTQWFMDVQTGMPFEGVTHWHEIDYPQPPAN